MARISPFRAPSWGHVAAQDTSCAPECLAVIVHGTHSPRMHLLGGLSVIVNGTYSPRLLSLLGTSGVPERLSAIEHGTH